MKTISELIPLIEEWARWYQKNIIKNEFAIEGVDWQ